MCSGRFSFPPQAASEVALRIAQGHVEPNITRVEIERLSEVGHSYVVTYTTPASPSVQGGSDSFGPFNVLFDEQAVRTKYAGADLSVRTPQLDAAFRGLIRDQAVRTVGSQPVSLQLSATSSVDGRPAGMPLSATSSVGSSRVPTTMPDEQSFLRNVPR